jgi:hypothetical protein
MFKNGIMFFQNLEKNTTILKPQNWGEKKEINWL